MGPGGSQEAAYALQTSVPAGTYTLTARAVDNAGATATSTSVAITVSAPAPGPTAPGRKPTARNIIYLYMAGGMTHVDTFDPKPAAGEKIAGAV